MRFSSIWTAVKVFNFNQRSLTLGSLLLNLHPRPKKSCPKFKIMAVLPSKHTEKLFWCLFLSIHASHLEYLKHRILPSPSFSSIPFFSPSYFPELESFSTLMFDKCTPVASFKSFNSELEGPVQAGSYAQNSSVASLRSIPGTYPATSTAKPRSGKFRRKFKAW